MIHADYILYLLKETFAQSLLLLIPGAVLAKRKRLGMLLMIVYLTAVTVVVGTPCLPFVWFSPNVNLIPLADIPGDFFNAVLNVLLFVPLGFLLPQLWKDYGTIRKTVGFGLVFSLSIEISQLFSGRTTDINDLLTNACGTALGFLLASRLPQADDGQSREPVCLCAGIMLFRLFFGSMAINLFGL